MYNFFFSFSLLFFLFSSSLDTKYLVWWLILFFRSLIQGATCRLMLLGFFFHLLLFLFCHLFACIPSSLPYHSKSPPNQMKYSKKKKQLYFALVTVSIYRGKKVLLCVCVFFFLAWFFSSFAVPHDWWRLKKLIFFCLVLLYIYIYMITNFYFCFNNNQIWQWFIWNILFHQ
jgi:hypothetical protein